MISALPDGLLEIMQCPSCAGVLVEEAEPSSLVCRGCGLRYPIDDGIPVMLIEAATPSGNNDPGHGGA